MNEKLKVIGIIGAIVAVVATVFLMFNYSKKAYFFVVDSKKKLKSIYGK